MKAGKLPPEPFKCAFDCLEKDDYFPVLGYKGSCPNCQVGEYPQEFWGIYLRNDGIYHIFKTMEEVRCNTCQSILVEVAVMCHAESVNVTSEFKDLKGEL